MASDIPSTSAFSLTNMKPASGEIIDAVWGQKMAENFGFFYYAHPVHYSSWSVVESEGEGGVNDGMSGTHWFVKTPHDTLTGTVSGTSILTDGGVLTVKVNGVTIVSESWGGASFGTGISYDISGLTNGVWYPISWSSTDMTASGRIRSHSASLWGTRAP